MKNALDHNGGMTQTGPPDLGALFDEHVADEFVAKDVDANKDLPSNHLLDR